MTAEARREDDWRQLEVAIARMRAGIMAVVFGMVGGCGLFAATAILLLKGGPNVGRHLSLLTHYFPGYSVTWPGALLGLLYGGLCGAFCGWLICLIYNRVASRRERSPSPR